MSQVVDLFAAQGMLVGMIYDYVADPPWGPPHRCPGCQERPDEPSLGALWDKWRALDVKLVALGESSSCPIARGETMPAPYTNEERVTRGCVQTDRLPKFVAPTIAPIEPVEAAPIVAEVPIEVPIEVAHEPEKKRKAPTKRAPKEPKTPEEQRGLF